MDPRNVAAELVREALERERQRIGSAAKAVVGLGGLVAVLSAGSALAAGQMLPASLVIGAGVFAFWALFAWIVHAIRTRAPLGEHPLVVALEGPPGAISGVREVTVRARRGPEKAIVVELANQRVLALADPESHAELLRALVLALSGATPDPAAAERALAPRKRRRRRVFVSVVLAIGVPVALATVQYQLAWDELGECDEVWDDVERRANELALEDVRAVTASVSWPGPEPVESLEACGPIEEPLVYERSPEPDFPAPHPAEATSLFPGREPFFSPCGFEPFSLHGHSRGRARATRVLETLERPRPFVDVAESTYRYGDGIVTQEFRVRVLDLEHQRVTCDARFVLEAADAGRLSARREATVDRWLDEIRGR